MRLEQNSRSSSQYYGVMTDNGDKTVNCEMCGQSIRYQHRVEHSEFRDLEVGEEGQRFYKVKGKGRYQPLWEPAEMFDTTGCIVDYWDELKRAGGGKRGGKGKGRASSSSSSSSSGGRGR